MPILESLPSSSFHAVSSCATTVMDALLQQITMISGIVTKGMGLAGKIFGVPTANISLIVPAELAPGTYAGIAKWGNQRFPSMIYYGKNTPLKLEVHLLDWSGDLYGTVLTATPLAKIADYQPWVSTEVMKIKIADDLQRVRTWFALQKKAA